MVFFSYRTKHKLLAGDQLWKFSRQCSIFGGIGDQWVAISSPESLIIQSKMWALIYFLLCSFWQLLHNVQRAEQCQLFGPAARKTKQWRIVWQASKFDSLLNLNGHNKPLNVEIHVCAKMKQITIKCKSLFSKMLTTEDDRGFAFGTGFLKAN